MTEIFRTVVGFSRYLVSDHGTVKSTIRGGRIMKPWENLAHGKSGYWRVALMTDDGSSVVKILVHRIVAQAFIPNPDNFPTINHKNGIKTDNRVDNLEWVSFGENNEHGRQNGLIKDFGENHYLAQLTNDQAVEIRRLAASGVPNRQIAEDFGVKPKTVYRIVTRQRWARI